MSDKNIKLNIVAIATCFWGLGLPLFVCAQNMNSLQKPSFEKLQVPQKNNETLRFTKDGKIELTKDLKSLSVQQIRKLLSETGGPVMKPDPRGKSLGGEVSGGGTTLLWKGQRRLLDVSSFKQVPGVSNSVNSKDYGTKRIERIALETTAINARIQKVFQRAGIVSPKLSLTLQRAYKDIPFYFAAGQFREMDTNFYLDPKNRYPEQAQVFTTAFNVQNMGVLISRKHFLEMDEFNQAALIVHELLRSMQVQLSAPLSNPDVQNLTAALVDTNADLRGALRESSLGLLVGAVAEDALFERFQSLIEVARVSYRLSPSACYDHLGSMPDWYDIADEASLFSSKLLQFITLNQQVLNSEERLQTQALLEQFDIVAINARVKGLQLIHAKAWGAMAQLLGVLLQPQSDIIKTCSEQGAAEATCSEFYDTLNSLID